MAAPDNEQRSNWLEAITPSEEMLRLILQLAYSFEEQWGRRITVAELQSRLRRPGA